MKVTREMAAGKLEAYLHGEIGLDQLVDWAEAMMMDGEIDESGFEATRDVLARLGVADVRHFGLSWEDCQALMRELGYKLDVKVEAM